MTNYDPAINTCFLDLDGVLADYEALGNKILGGFTRDYEHEHGTDAYYAKLRSYGHFFRDLPLMPGALHLYNAVKHLNPIILSGIPWQVPEATVDKVYWVHENIDPNLIVITPRSRDKALYCKPGDVIIDDWPKHKQKWVDKGGIWVDHVDVFYTLEKLVELGILS